MFKKNQNKARQIRQKTDKPTEAACYNMDKFRPNNRILQMAILDLKYYGASVLTRPAKPIKNIDRELIKLAEDMLESMYHYHGVGLAAPQVGVSKRFIIVDCGDEYQDRPYFLINPEVVSTEGEQIGPEGCLSLPDLLTDVKRPA